MGRTVAVAGAPTWRVAWPVAAPLLAWDDRDAQIGDAVVGTVCSVEAGQFRLRRFETYLQAAGDRAQGRPSC
jgi:hypothetical protein